MKQISPPHERLQDGEFRLLRIQNGNKDDVLSCDIHDISLEEVVQQYCAVSYCWGPSSQPQKVLFLNGRVTTVGESLFTCLREFCQARSLVSMPLG
jgi:hypothetical protein